MVKARSAGKLRGKNFEAQTASVWRVAVGGCRAKEANIDSTPLAGRLPIQRFISRAMMSGGPLRNQVRRDNVDEFARRDDFGLLPELREMP
jgi:hypothetical protein